MSRVIVRFTLASAMLLMIAAATSAQTQTTSTETKSFEVIAVQGNDLVVKLPEGTRELTVPEDFRFTVDGQQVSVHDLKPGMKGTATITTKTTMHPVYVTQVKNGTVRQVSGSSIIVQTDEGFKSFTQGDVDKRGVKIIKNGQPAELSDFHTGDQLSATIVTEKPPRVVTEKAVNATTARSAPPDAAASSAPAKSSASASSQPAAGTAGTSAPAHKLPKTASPLPLVGLAGIASLAIALALAARRRSVAR
jgi:hypothetical protein